MHEDGVPVFLMVLIAAGIIAVFVIAGAVLASVLGPIISAGLH